MRDELLAAIETIYDCVGDDFDRRRALKAYSRAADDSAVVMADMNILLGRAVNAELHNIDGRARDSFVRRFECPARRKLLDAMRTLPACVPMMRQSVVSGNEWLGSRLYEMGSKPWNLHSEGACFISGKVLTKTFCFFFRHPEQEPIDAETLSVVAILNNHLHRSMSLQHRIDGLEDALIRSNSVLDLIQFGLFLYDVNKRPAFVNVAARRAIDENDGLRLREDRLEINHRGAGEQFQRLLDAIYTPGPHISQRAGGIVAVPRPSRLRPYSLMVVPMRSQKLNLGNVTAAVFLFDPHVRKTTAIQMFVTSYELTPSEAELAHSLALGHSLDEAAALRGVSRNTAKSQLHSIFEKTETNRQSELVSLLLRSLVGINLKV